MSIAAQTFAALLRAVLISGLALAIATPLSRWLPALRGRRAMLALAALLAPFLTPPLLVSYAFSKFALTLVVAPWSHEALYLGVLALKLAPVAVITRILVPEPLSAEALHCYRANSRASFLQRARFRLRGAGAGPWVAAGLVFVLAFADFELASLWSVKTWTVALFDAQTGGLALRETLRLAATPFAVQVLALLFVAKFFLIRGGPVHDTAAPPMVRGKAALVAYLAISASVVTVIPLLIVAGQSVRGLPAIAENFVLGKEIAASVLFAFGAAALAFAAARAARGSRRLVCGLPGLLGALVVALLLLALFQVPPWRAAYDTPLPLLLASTILLLPLALLLEVLERHARTPARHVAKQTGSRRLAWELELRPRLAGFGLLSCWAYFDFTASSILAPIGLTPVFVRLHNLAHYGQTAVLSAMLLAAFAGPLLLLLLTGAAGQFYARRDGR